MERYICIHGHYYQSPRENSWLEAIETQDSAYPCHDWNERITAECYEPNATSRILDGEGRIVKIVNNFSYTSFNVEPTLLSWLEQHSATPYARIIEADRESDRLFSGHGSVLAQVYNHVIMPLASQRDKLTQVRWGIRDFEHRFGRKPGRKWLPETAVDVESLEVLAARGMRFTVLAPHQAKKVRRFRGRNWYDVSGARIERTMAHEVRLPSRRKIAVFFYDGPISPAAAFVGLLARGEFLAGRLVGAFSDERERPQLVHIAIDGETYGHHHCMGDMGLAYALDHITRNESARTTNYGEFLQLHPPTHEARIVEDTSWSCVHGIERWRSDCGCNIGRPTWNQAWRGTLRNALDWLCDELVSRFETMRSTMFKDPWEARDSYIDVVLDRSNESVKRLFHKHASHKLGDAVSSNALQLLEIQRHCLLMYTSCGWFFGDLSGIETLQVMQYAGRAMHLAEHLFDIELENEFCSRLAKAKSNVSVHRNGRHIYDKIVRPLRVGVSKVGAIFSVSSLFEDYKEQNKLFCFTTEVGDFRVKSTGRVKLVVGNASIRSEITRHASRISFCVVHWGDHNLHGGVGPYDGEEAYQSFVKQVTEAFQHAESPMVVRLLDQKCQASTYSLRSLFRDEQRKILNIIFDAGPAERTYRQLFEQIAPLMSFLAGLGAPNPKAIQMVAKYVLNLYLHRALEKDVDPQCVRNLFDQARMWRINIDMAGLDDLLESRIQEAAESFRVDVHNHDLLVEFDELVSLAKTMSPRVNLRPAQNVQYELLKSIYPAQRDKAAAGDEAAQLWCNRFRTLAIQLAVYVESSR